MLKQIKPLAAAMALTVAGMGAAQAEGLYVGGSLGAPHYNSSIDGVGGNGSGVSGKAFGGYQITPNLAVEGGFFDLGHIDDANGKVKLRGVFGDVVGSYEFAPQFSVLGRAGLADGRFKGPTADDSSPALKLGTGLQYDLTKQVALRAEYEYYHFTGAFDDKANVGTYTFGVKVGF